MELIVLIPIIMLMGVVAVLMAVHEQPLPAGASSAFTPIPIQQKRMKADAARKSEAKGAAIEKIIQPGGSPEIHARSEETEMTTEAFSHTDVLLADALTEMIGLKAELYHLRSKIDNLNTEVARLAGGPPRTPPAASKKPIPLRKAA